MGLKDITAVCYMAKNYELLSTGSNNIVGARMLFNVFFNVFFNIVQHCYT